MKEFDQYDNKIESILTANIYEPDSYTNAILNALNKKREKKTISLPKLVAAIIAGAMIIGGVVYAKQIGEFITRFFNNSKGTDTAVENGYVTDFSKEFITDSDTKVTINSLLIDDFDLNLKLRFDFGEKYKEIYSISIPDLLITDESCNILYCKNKEMFDQYCYLNNLNYEFLSYNENYINTCIYKAQNNKNNEIIFNIKTIKEFPKSKELKIEFNHILLDTESAKQTRINGNWKVEIKLEEKFYNREAVIYKVVDLDGLNTNEIAFRAYSTETFFEFNALLKPYITDDMTDQEMKAKIIEFENWCKESQNKQIKSIYIETTDGKIYNELNNNFEDEEIEYFYNGNFYYKTSLDLTKYDLTDTLIIYFTLYTINEDKDVTIKLEKDDKR